VDPSTSHSPKEATCAATYVKAGRSPTMNCPIRPASGDGAGNDDLIGSGVIGDAGCDVDGDPADVATAKVDLTGVDSGTHADPDGLQPWS
jgi:hypothetical protein